MKSYYMAVTLQVNFGALGDREVTIHGVFSPGTPDVMYLSNGDPGYPGTPAEFEALRIVLNLPPDRQVGLLQEDFLEDHYEALIDRCIEEIYNTLEPGHD